MDALINVFVGLGVDQTIAIQFVIFVVVFFILKIVLFDKLKEIIIYREDQTSNLLKNSENINRESQDLEGKYKEMLGDAYKKAQEKINEEKNNTMITEDKRFKNSKNEILTLEEKKRSVIIKDIDVISNDILLNDKELSNQLVTKLIR